jgi:hypothetical protein
MIEDSAVTASKLATGAVVQVACTSSNALVTGTTVVPNDNTIPQNTEGVAVPGLDTAITPLAAANSLIIDVVLNVSNSAANCNIIAALFVDTTADALQAAAQTYEAGAEYITLRLRCIVSAGSTSARTYKVRVGGHTAGTTTVNGQSGAAMFGGVLSSSMTITEVKG